MSKESEKGIVTLPINKNTDDNLWGESLHPVSGKKKEFCAFKSIEEG
jgi:hypothetical protein